MCKLGRLSFPLLLAACMVACDGSSAGEAYHSRDGRSAITLISRDELEYRLPDGTTLLGKYSRQDDGLRVVLTTLGTQQVLYFRRVPNGLRADDGVLYLDAAGLAEAQREDERVLEERRAAQALEEARQAERLRVAAEVAAREADERRAAEERARREAPEKLRLLLATLPVLNGTYQTGYGATAVTLKILSFNSTTGAVSAEAEFAPEKGRLKRANGIVSGDRLELTVLALSDSQPWMLMKLRYDGLARLLDGQWFNAGSDRGSGLTFPLS